MARPKLVLTRTLPSLFLPQSLCSVEPEPSALLHTALSKVQAYQLLFSHSHAHFPMDIPDTLLKTPGARQAIYLAVDSKGFLLCVECRAEDTFFRNSFAAHMMGAFVRPSPFLVPKFVVHWQGGVVFCKDQAEVLRLLEGTDWYLVQRFVQAKEQRAQKFRVKWNCGEHVSVKLVYKNRLYPYNTPSLHTVQSRGETPVKGRKRGAMAVNALEPQRKHKEDTHSHISPFAASFSTADEDCISLETHRQEAEDQAGLFLEYLHDLLDTSNDTLRMAEFDLMQGQSSWVFLNLKSYTTAKRQERAQPRHMRLRALTHYRNKSGDEAMRGIKELLRLDRSFVARSQYIDLDEVQDRNIRLYALIKDSLAAEPM